MMAETRMVLALFWRRMRMWIRPRWVLFGALVGAGVGAGARLLIPRVYETEVGFFPEPNTDQSSGLAALSGLAGQFGFAIGNNSGAQTPQFYGDLIVSRTVLDWVLNSPDSCTTPTAPLRQYFLSGKDASRPDGEERARRRLRAVMDVTVNARTNVITVATRTQSACHAKGIASAALAAVVYYNQHVKNRRTSIRRAFVERQYRQMLDTLAARENQLRVFYEENRTWESAPRLRLQEASLQRRVTLSTEVVTVLARELEQARIAEADDAPFFSIVVAPEVPQTPADHGAAFWSAVACVVGAILVALAEMWRFQDVDVTMVTQQG